MFISQFKEFLGNENDTRQTGEWSMICARPTLLTLAWASGRVLMSHPAHLKPQRVSSIFEAIKTEKSETATTFPPSYLHIRHKNVRCIHHEPRTKNLSMMHVDREGSHRLQCVLRFLEHNQPELNTYDVQILISVYSTFLNLWDVSELVLTFSLKYC